MEQLLEVFDLLSVLLRGAALAFQSLVMGGILFSVCVAGPFHPKFDVEVVAARKSCRRVIRWCAAALGLTQLFYLVANSAILAGTTGVSWRELGGANFFRAQGAAILGAAVIFALSARKRPPPMAVMLGASAVILGASVMTSHAIARMDHRLPLALLTAMHQAATASWIGGLPYLLIALARCSESDAAVVISRRFSRLALASVAILVMAGVALSVAYVGSIEAIYGTAYGVTLAVKVILLGSLLILGALNYFVVRRLPAGGTAGLTRVRRFAEVEIGIGFTVILAAASVTAQPPAVDLTVDRVSAAEIAERMRPRWPRMRSPNVSDLSPATPLRPQQVGQPGFSLAAPYVPGGPVQPNSPADIAWSEYNHHWAGLMVLLMGLLAVAARTGRASWARHWPLVFLGLAAFLFLRSDAENWPLGPRGFWESFQVAEVLQHRISIALISVFAVFEWKVQTGRITSPRAALVFPLVCVTGGAVLLLHSHSLVNVKEELLVKLTHIPLVPLAVLAGTARWLEIRLPSGRLRIPAQIWPVCFVLIGALLLLYREA